jgi:hypothetical protein
VRASFDGGSTLLRLEQVGLVLILSGAVYLLLARLLRLKEAGQIMTTALDLLPGSGDRGAQ